MPDATGSDTRPGHVPVGPTMRETSREPHPSGSLGRVSIWSSARVYPIGLIVTLVPVWISAWQVASSGLYPTSDAALTVMRARDLFGGDVPLLGMPAASGAFDGAVTYFPGPWQLWWLGVFVQLFGDVWGPPVAMAALASVWIVVSTWVLRRMLGPRVALAGAALLGVFAWSIEIGHLVDPVPVLMVIFPVLPFLLTAWCASTGDRTALVVAAVIGNYLWLDHLVLVLVVPVIGVGALVGYLLAHRHHWFDRSDENRPERRHAWRGLTAAAAVSAVMWLPTLIAEATRSPGNLHLLFRSSGHEREVIASWRFAFQVAVDLITYPPFWLRGSFDDPPYYNMPLTPVLRGSPAVQALIAGALLIGAFVWLGLRARRRDDRIALWALIMAVVAFCAAVPTIYLTPTAFGVSAYLRPLWGIAAFVWFALAFATYRLVWRPPTKITVPVLGAVILVVAGLNVPVTVRGYVPDEVATSTVTEVNRVVLDELDDGDAVALQTRPDYTTHEYFGALVLALRTAGIDFCVLYGSPPLAGVDSCDRQRRRVFAIEVTDEPPPVDADGPRIVTVVPMYDDEQRADYERLEGRVRAWLADDDGLRLSPAAQASLEAAGPGALESVAPLLAPSTDPALTEVRRDLLETTIALWISVPEQRDVHPFADAPLTLDELTEWRDLIIDRRYVVVSETGVYPDR